jgi:hypothetical protein
MFGMLGLVVGSVMGGSAVHEGMVPIGRRR